MGVKHAARGPKTTHQSVQSGPWNEFGKCENHNFKFKVTAVPNFALF